MPKGDLAQLAFDRLIHPLQRYQADQDMTAADSPVSIWVIHA